MADTTYTYESLYQDIIGVRDERSMHANTATRVGDVLLGLLHYTKEAMDAIDGLDIGGYWETVVNARTGKKYAHLKTEFAGAYTDGDLSALGMGISDDEEEEGGGSLVLTEPLSSINSAGLGTPSEAGVGLVWDGTQWTYGQTGGLDLQALAQYLSDGGYATQAWVNGLGYSTKTWVRKYFVRIADLNSYTWWGQSLQSGVVSGSLTSVTDITMTGHISIGGFIIEYDATKNALKFNGDIYATGGVSALGKNSDEEGGGTLALTEPLASINSAGLGSPSEAGVGLVWDGTQWTYGQTGGLDLEALAQYLSSGGYATQQWVRNQNFVTLAAVNAYTWWGQSLHNGVVSGSLTSVTDITMTGRISIGGFIIEYDATKNALKFNGDIYATGGVSALGKNSDEEGGGTLALTEPLASINSAGLGSPSEAGVCLVWDGTQWTYGQTGGLDLEALAQYLSSGGYATQQWVRNQGYLTAHQSLDDYATKQWVQNQGYLTTHQSLEGYATETWVTGLGYATKSWVRNQNFVTLAAVNAYTWWGQSLQNGVVSGSLTSVTDITMTGRISIGGFIIEYDATKNALKFNGDIYATGGVSALGKNSDEEGGGTLELTEPLASINSAGLGSPSEAGVGLVWDGTQWTYGQTGGLDLEALAQYLSSGGYATKQWVRNQGYLTAHQSLDDYATKQWVQNQGYLTTHQSLAGYATESWVNSQGFLKNLNSYLWWGRSVSSGEVKGTLSKVTSVEFTEVGASAGHGGYLDFHYNGSSADYTSRLIEDVSGRLNLNDRIYAFKTAVGGNSASMASPVSDYSNVSFNVRLTGNILTEAIYSNGDLHLRNTKGILMKDTSGTSKLAARVDNGDNLVFGEGFQRHEVYLRGRELHFQVATGQGNYTNTEALTLDYEGNLILRRNARGFYLRDSGDANYNALHLNANNVLHIGYGAYSKDYQTLLFGGANKGIGFYAGSTLVASIYKDSSRGGLRIGDALLSWDSANNALKVQRYDGTAVNLYSLGGVSALGLSDDGEGTDSATINVLTSTTVNTQRLELTNMCYMYHDEDELHIVANDGFYIKDSSSNVLFKVDSDGWGFSKSWIVGDRNSDGELRLYYNGHRYLMNLQKCLQAGLITYEL